MAMQNMINPNPTDQPMTADELYALLSHPDPKVRSLADWTREFRGFGTRGLLSSEWAANTYEQQLRARLARLAVESTMPRCSRGCAEPAVLDGLCRACWNTEIRARTTAIRAAYPECFGRDTGRDRRREGR